MTNQTLRTLAVLMIAFALAGCTGSGKDSDTPDDGPLDGTTPTTPPSSPPASDDPSGPEKVDLGSAEEYVILAQTGVSVTGVTSVVGHIGVSPSGGTAVTGFDLTMDASNEYATSALVSGRIYAADFAAPSPVKMTSAVADMRTAYTDAAGRVDPTDTELGAGNIGSMTLRPGTYAWSSGVNVLTDITLSGGSTDIWIFQVSQNLLFGPGVEVVLSGGAQAENVFWQVAGQTTLSVGSDVSGIILCQTAIVFDTGATLTGRAFAQTAVTLDSNEVVQSQ